VRFYHESYLRYVLERIADHPINQIEDLRPWNLLAKMPDPPSQAEQAVNAAFGGRLRLKGPGEVQQLCVAEGALNSNGTSANLAPDRCARL
jgi:hypothetical protein